MVFATPKGGASTLSCSIGFLLFNLPPPASPATSCIQADPRVPPFASLRDCVGFSSLLSCRSSFVLCVCVSILYFCLLCWQRSPLQVLQITAGIIWAKDFSDLGQISFV